MRDIGRSAVGIVGAVGSVVLGGVVATACSESGGQVSAPLCEAEEIAAALEEARSGDTVRVGSCRVRGSFVVPAGVTLEGAGRGVTILEGPGGAVAVLATPGDPASTIADLDVESHGPLGIAATGAGKVVVERVDVSARTGLGLGAQDLSGLEVHDVTVTGALTDANQNFPPDDAATYGIVLVRVQGADLTDVLATRFAESGAVIVEGSTTWIRGGVPANLGHGLLVSGGEVDLQELDLGGTLERGLELAPAAAAVFRSGALVQTVGLSVEGSEGYGIVHDDVSATHVDLTAHGNDLTAVWVQNSESIELSGEATDLSGNGQAGLLAIETSSVTVRGARVADIETEVTIVLVDGEQSNVPVGDGLQIVGPVDTVTLESLTLANNARVGVLVDLDGGSAEVTITDVTVEGTGEQLGAIVQRGEAPDGWSAGVTRLGATEANDADQTLPLGVAEIINPIDLPDAAALAEGIGLP